MPQIFLVVILYICFISLGLPDGVLGVAWPQMRLTFNAPLSLVGIVSVITTVFSTAASFFSGRILAKLGTRNVTIISCCMTAVGMVLYAFVPSITFVFVLTILMGFGAGSVDSGLNHYVAKHYSSRVMSWLHSCWGVGATVGPLVFTFFSDQPLLGGIAHPWRQGYLAVGAIQIVIAIFLLTTMSAWKKGAPPEQTVLETQVEHQAISATKLFFTPKALLSSLTFFVYCAAEAGVGLWTASFLIEARGMSHVTAGYFVTLYWGSLMVIRFLGGFVADKVGNRGMVFGGLSMAIIGAILLGLNISTATTVVGLMLIGGGFAPVYPCMMHETGKRFTPAENLHMIGFQAGMAMLGCSILPALMGVLFQVVSLSSLPFIVLGLLVITLGITLALNRYGQAEA